MIQYSVRPDAVARISGGSSAPDLSGEVQFFQQRSGVVVNVQVSGLPKNDSGFFALHIHEGGSCAGTGFPDTGGHYNPMVAPHPHHAGDLPPLLNNNGSAWMSVRTDRFTIREVLGRTVVIHSGADDFRSQPAGNPGTKIACGVIRPR